MKRQIKLKPNSPCPCGSGRKYKKCCAKKVNNVVNYNFPIIQKNLHPERKKILLDGKRLFQLHNISEAEECFKQCIQIDPLWSEPIFMLGLVNEVKGNIAIAIEFMEKAIIYNKDPFYYYSVATLYTKRAEMEGNLAADYYEQAIQRYNYVIEKQKNFYPAYEALGNIYFKARKFNEALYYFQQTLQYSPQNEFAKFAAAVIKQEQIDIIPEKFVIKIFDSFAFEFEDKLTQQLAYKLPFLAQEILLKLAQENTKYEYRVLDLGCGTGLFANNLKEHTKFAFYGVDLSAEMLKKAAQKGIYKQLYNMEIGQFLNQTELQVDFVVALDVFIYIGNLDAIFAKLENILRKNGNFIFSIEKLEANTYYQIQRTIRFCHNLTYIKLLAEKYNFIIKEIQEVDIRREMDDFIKGYLLTLEKI